MMKWLEKHPRRGAILIAFNVIGGAFNVGWALVFPDSYFVWLNWFAAGGCFAMAASQPTINKLHQLISDQTATIIASNAAMEAVSPAHMRTMLHGALTAVVEDMKREGILPAEAEVTIDQDNRPKILH